MGNGSFILPLNATIRKAINKKAGDKVSVALAVDERKIELNADLIKCLKDDPIAYEHFNSLAKSHQIYFSKWIESAKTSATKTKRITMAVMALSSRKGYPEMIRENKQQSF
jgi:uncharacterized protein YdeI (YjbR/CyaY-like superfamily)